MQEKHKALFELECDAVARVAVDGVRATRMHGDVYAQRIVRCRILQKRQEAYKLSNL